MKTYIRIELSNGKTIRTDTDRKSLNKLNKVLSTNRIGAITIENTDERITIRIRDIVCVVEEL